MRGTMLVSGILESSLAPTHLAVHYQPPKDSVFERA